MVFDFRCRMTFSSSIPCKIVPFVGNGAWVCFGVDFKNLKHFQWGMFILYSNGAIDSSHAQLLSKLGFYVCTLAKDVLSHFHQVFVQGANALSSPSHKVVFYSLNYGGIQYNWSLRIMFFFDGLNRDNMYVCYKGMLDLQFPL